MSNVDTLRRQYLIITYLQTYTRYTKQAASSEQIYTWLCRKDLPVTRRMVQRDLLILQKAIPSVRRRHGNPAGWTFEPPPEDNNS